MNTDTNGTPAQVWAALTSGKEIDKRLGISSAHRHSMVKRGLFPAPAIRMGTRYTRWKSSEVIEWASDPQGWIARNPKQNRDGHGGTRAGG